VLSPEEIFKATVVEPRLIDYIRFNNMKTCKLYKLFCTSGLILWSGMCLAEPLNLICRISGHSLGLPVNEEINVVVYADAIQIKNSYDFPMTVKAVVSDSSVIAVGYSLGKFSNGQQWNKKTDIEINRLSGTIMIRSNVVTGGKIMDQYVSGACRKVTQKAF
jgi:hypothetical protein